MRKVSFTGWAWAPRERKAKSASATMVGRTPRSARDALVPHPAQRGEPPAPSEQADGGVGRGPGGPPHQFRGIANLSTSLISLTSRLDGNCNKWSARRRIRERSCARDRWKTGHG